jgi:hypothetical protein
MKGTAAWVSLVLAISTPATAGPWAMDRPAPASAVENEERFSEPVLPPAPKPLNPWKPIFGISLGLAVTATAFTYYARHRQDDEANRITTGTSFTGGPLTQDDCDSGAVGIDSDSRRHFESACSWNTRSQLGLIGAVSLGTFTVVAAYFAFRTQPSDRLIAVTPTVTRESAGAQLSVAW